MARIRSVKPEFFRHEALFELERETAMPLRLAFAGLWTAADREGRFRWMPRQLKLDCLPYDDVDFSRVLDALAARGFIVKYAIDGKEYGVIPSWHQHQVINNREKASDLPPPNNLNDLTREARVDDATGTPLSSAQGEGKGKEGERKGREREERARDASTLPEDFALTPADIDAAHSVGMTDATIDAELKIFKAKKRSAGTKSADWSSEWVIWCERWKAMQPQKSTDPPVESSALDYDKQLSRFKRGMPWNSKHWGPEPGQLGCMAPAELLEKYGFNQVH